MGAVPESNRRHDTGQITQSRRQERGGTADKGVILHLFLSGFAHTRSRSFLFALFITCRREAASCLETRYIRYKRDKPPGKKKERKRKKWIFFDESRYKRGSPCGALRPSSFSSFHPGTKCSRNWRTFQIMSHQRKRAAATAQLCAIFCLFCRRNRRKRNFKNACV